MNAELLGTQAAYLPCSANLGYEKQRLSIFQRLLRRNPPVSRNLRQPGFQLAATGQVIQQAAQNISSSVFGQCIGDYALTEIRVCSKGSSN